MWAYLYYNRQFDLHNILPIINIGFLIYLPYFCVLLFKYLIWMKQEVFSVTHFTILVFYIQIGIIILCLY